MKNFEQQTLLLKTFYDCSYYLLYSPFRFIINPKQGFVLHQTKLQYVTCLSCWMLGNALFRIYYTQATLSSMSSHNLQNPRNYFVFISAMLEVSLEFLTQYIFFLNSSSILEILNIFFLKQNQLPKGKLKVNQIKFQVVFKTVLIFLVFIYFRFRASTLLTYFVYYARAGTHPKYIIF